MSKGGRHSNGTYRTRTWWNNYKARMQRGEEHCRECGSTSELTFDHIIPAHLGGRYTLGNVTILCDRCNMIRDNAPAGDHVRSLVEEEAERPFEQQWSKQPLDPDSPWARKLSRRVPVDGYLVAAGIREDLHGTVSGFRTYGCRCTACRNWHDTRPSKIRRQERRTLEAECG